MALSAALLSFSTGTGTSNIPVTGAGFQPTLVIFFGAAASADALMMFGAATSATERACVGAFCSDAAATTSTAAGLFTDGCLLEPSTTPGVNGELDFVSMDADGFTVIPDNAFPGSRTVNALCLGGADLTNVKVGTFEVATGTGNQAVAGVGFQADCVIFFWVTRLADLNTAANGAEFGIGWATSSTARASLVAASRDAVADTDSRAMVMTDTCINILGHGGVDTIADNHDFVSMDADGFTVNKLAGADTPYVGYIAMKGPRFKVATTAMVVGTTNQVVTGVGFQGKALLTLFRSPVTASETTAPSAHWEIGMGCAIDSTHRAAIWTADEDALTTSDNYSKNSATRCVIDFDKETGATDEGDMDFVSWDVDGFTLDQDTASAVAVLVPYLVIGDAAAAAAGNKGPLVNQGIVRRLVNGGLVG